MEAITLELRSLEMDNDLVEIEPTRSGDNSAMIDNTAARPPRRCCAGARLVIREEFRWKNFGFNFERERQFYCSQWAWPRCVFLTYRLVLAAYMLTSFLYSVVVSVLNAPRHPWIVYLTYWSYVLLTAHFLISAITALVFFNYRQCCTPSDLANDPTSDDLTKDPLSDNLANDPASDEPVNDLNADRSNDISKELEVPQVAVSPGVNLRWYFRLDWILFSISSCAAVLVTSVYFAALYPNIRHKYPTLTFNDVNTHLMNSIVIFMELVVTAIPVRLVHVVYTIIFCLGYAVFSAIYWAFDHENILYPGLVDWDQPKISGLTVLIVSLCVLPCISVLIFVAYQLRLSIHRRLNKL